MSSLNVTVLTLSIILDTATSAFLFAFLKPSRSFGADISLWWRSPRIHGTVGNLLHQTSSLQQARCSISMPRKPIQVGLALPILPPWSWRIQTLKRARVVDTSQGRTGRICAPTLE